MFYNSHHRVHFVWFLEFRAKFCLSQMSYIHTHTLMVEDFSTNKRDTSESSSLSPYKPIPSLALKLTASWTSQKRSLKLQEPILLFLLTSNGKIARRNIYLFKIQKDVKVNWIANSSRLVSSFEPWLFLVHYFHWPASFPAAWCPFNTSLHYRTQIAVPLRKGILGDLSKYHFNPKTSLIQGKGDPTEPDRLLKINSITTFLKV